MRILLLCALTASTASAATVTWSPVAPPTRATIAAGPWVLAQGTAAYPTPNPGINSFQPYYQAYTTGTDQIIQGYFDYRPKDLGEAIVAATSTDGGRSWTFQSQALVYTPDPAAPDDLGEGHPFVWSIGGHTYLYTLDRSTGAVDALGLLVREIAPTAADPLAGAPADADPGSTTVQRTVGLSDPDGILAIVPGAPGQLMVLQKDVSVTPNVVTVHLVGSSDGINFDHDRVVDGLVTAAQPFVGPRGTLVQYSDGHYGLFFSAGLPGEDADAIHFIGYAESDDLVSWSLVNDVDHPLLSTDATRDPTGGQLWYAGRVYAPSVTLSADQCNATLTFSGYQTLKVKDAPDDYRQVGALSLGRCAAPADGGAGDAALPGSDGVAAGSDGGAAPGSDGGAAAGSDGGVAAGSDGGAASGGDAGTMPAGGRDTPTAGGGTASGRSRGCQIGRAGAPTGTLAWLWLVVTGLVGRAAQRKRFNLFIPLNRARGVSVSQTFGGEAHG
jgi:hypothetical protein